MRIEVTSEAEVRAYRNHLLAASDWTQVADAPVDQQAWAVYRQALRDFPATWTPGPVADFPLAPGEQPPLDVEEVAAVSDDLPDDVLLSDLP